MPITYPLSLPTATGIQTRNFMPETSVGVNESPFTKNQQVYAWPGQRLAFEFELPPMTDQEAGEWSAFFLSLNGREGTFLAGDPVRTSSLGNIAGTWTISGTQVANGTTITIAGGTGAPALGDWMQYDSGANSRLHRVIKVTGSAPTLALDVFPRLRSSYTASTSVTFVNAKGLFRLGDLPGEQFERDSLARGVAFTAVEAI